MSKISFEQKLYKAGADIEHRCQDIRIFIGSEIYSVPKAIFETSADYDRYFRQIYQMALKKGFIKSNRKAK